MPRCRGRDDAIRLYYHPNLMGNKVVAMRQNMRRECARVRQKEA